MEQTTRLSGELEVSMLYNLLTPEIIFVYRITDHRMVKVLQLSWKIFFFRNFIQEPEKQQN